MTEEPTTMQAIAGERLRLARQEAEMTQAQLGEAVAPYLGRPWSHQAVSSAEQGRREFTAVEVAVLGEILECSPAWFLTPSSAEVAIGTPGGQALDTRGLFRRVTAVGAPTLTAYVLRRIEHTIDRQIADLIESVDVIRGLRETAEGNTGGER